MFYALKAVGHVCVRRHELMTQCQPVLKAALAPAAPSQMKQQVLGAIR